MIKHICFDIDATLLDFKKGEQLAFHSTMKQLGLSNHPEDYELYTQINEPLWRDLEQKKITKEKLKIERFIRYLDQTNQKYDAHKLKASYEEELANQAILISHAFEVVSTCKNYVPVSAATNGITHIQRKRLSLSKLDTLFTHSFISEEMNCNKPEPLYFNKITNALNLLPHEILFIGDSLSADMKGAHLAGYKTIWYNPAYNANTAEIPIDYEITNLLEIPAIVEKLINEE